MKLNIKDKEIELKYSIRALLMYENMTDKTFSTSTLLTDMIVFMYCVVISSSKDYSLSFDEFIDYLDENPNAIQEFAEWLKNNVNSNNNFTKN
jgi:hypothetical protein